MKAGNVVNVKKVGKEDQEFKDTKLPKKFENSEMLLYQEELNDPILVENFSDISMVDPLNPVKSAEASILFMKNDTVEDYTSLIDLGNDQADD